MLDTLLWMWTALAIGSFVIKEMIDLYRSEPRAMIAFICIFALGCGLVIMNAAVPTVAPDPPYIGPQQGRLVG